MASSWGAQVEKYNPKRSQGDVVDIGAAEHRAGQGLRVTVPWWRKVLMSGSFGHFMVECKGLCNLRKLVRDP